MCIKLNTNEFIRKSKEVHGEKYDYSLVEYIGSGTKVKLICSVHGIFEQRPNDHTNGSGCPLCYGTYKKSKNQFISESNKVHGNRYDYSLIDYKDNKRKIKIICPIHGEFNQQPVHHLHGSGCPKCNGGISLTKENFIEKSKEVHDNRYDYSLASYKNVKSKIKIICDKHGVFNQEPQSHMNGSGCPSCSGTKKFTTKEFVERSKNIHNDKYDYSLVEYKNANKKIKIICKKHGVFEQQPYLHLQNQGCPKCQTSKGENEIRMFLEKNKIDYINQKEFKGCKYERQLKFDFYLPIHNLCIEFDGLQHYTSIDNWGGLDNFVIVQKRDSIKNEYCKDNNINLIRIKYNENVTNKLNNLIKKQ